MTSDSTESDQISGQHSGVSRRGFIAAGSALGALSVAAPALAPPALAQGAPAPRRPAWPNGAQLAIAVSMVVETDADPAPTLTGPENKKFPDLYGVSGGEYAWREGIPRMLDMFDRRRIKTTAMVCGVSAERHPDLAKRIVGSGHECAAHGKTHAVQFQMAREEEARFIQDNIDMLQKVTGQRPLGYNSRGQQRSENTLAILQELGFRYHIDDISRDEPWVETVGGKPFAVVPYTSHLGDIGYFNNRGSADLFARDLKYEFDALYEEGAHRPRLMVVTMHDAIARAARIRMFEEFIAYAQKHKGVWFARCDALASWALQNNGGKAA
jgi:peptidoglycan/xylan/chitin deacetylase (PgdA/CDA1 family)